MLHQSENGLPAYWYYDPEQFSKELSAIWFRNWICIGRESDWPQTGDYRLISLGDQNILVLRSQAGQLNAFHNTCRHRGSVLCESSPGRLKQGRIVCPYHAWAYDLEGKLQRTPRRVETDDFDPADFSLYQVALECWGGFVFICLEAQPIISLRESLGDEAELLANWPLDQLHLARREIHEVKCNWKIFWENYLECYHCPGIHPELCRLVPAYREGFVSYEDFEAVDLEAPFAPGRMLKDRAETWAPEGISGLPPIVGPTAEEQARGMSFVDVVPGIFVVAHKDYVRSVRVMPLGPETTQLTIDWLLPEASMECDPAIIENMVSFARQVVTEDARACELNQQGLKSNRHQHGVLMPQEYGVLAFNHWVRDWLAR